jgi:hypothetical protein
MSIFLDVEIRDTVTGISAVYHDTIAHHEDDDDYTTSYWWAEGNGGCDCNRSLFLNTALGGNHGYADLFPELDCDVNDNVLRVEVRDRASGRVLYTDMEHKDDFICPLPNT